MSARRSPRSIASIGMIGDAVRLTGLVTLGAGVLVLGGAVAAGHHRRVYDAVVLKVLGATRGAITRAFLIEHGALGALAALVAGALGTIAAYFLVTRLMKIEWVFLPAPLLWTVGARDLADLGARLCRNLARARRQAGALSAQRIAIAVDDRARVRHRALIEKIPFCANIAACEELSSLSLLLGGGLWL